MCTNENLTVANTAPKASKQVTCLGHVVAATCASGRAVGTTEYRHSMEAARLGDVHPQPRRSIGRVATGVRTAPLPHVQALYVLFTA